VPGLTSVTRALVRNTAWHGLVTVVGLGSGLAMSVLLARGLGPDRMGDYAYVTWAWTTLDAVATLGFAVATARYTAAMLARGDTGAAAGLTRHLLRRQAMSTTLVVAVAVPLILAAASPALRWPLLVVTLSLFPMTIESIYTHALFGAQRYDVTTRVSTLKMAVQLAVAAGVLALGLGVSGLVTAIAATLVGSCLLLRRAVRNVYPDPPADVDAPTRLDMRGYLVSLSLVTVLDTVVWDRSEVFFLGLWGDARDIAFYSLAFGLATRAMIVPEIAVGALLPAFSALHGAGNRAEFAAVYRTALRYVAAAGALVAALTAALAAPIIALLYGDAYAPAAVLLGPLAGVALVSALRQVAWAALPALGDRRSALTATAVAAVVNLALAAWLIRVYGAPGAVAANAAGQLLATAWVFVALARRHGCRFPGRVVVTIGAAAIGAFIVTHLVAATSTPHAPDVARLVVAGAAGSVVFLTACLLGGVVTPREWAVVVAAGRRA
jgi:O-antigen/teichoic acid export membrane protein